jgi:predicted DNA-binding antitoxin AbrB/MazE fold protein
MTITVEATYENGTLKLSQPLPLNEHEKVQVTVQAGQSLAERTAGMMGWKGSTEVAEFFATDPELSFPPTPEDES